MKLHNLQPEHVLAAVILVTLVWLRAAVLWAFAWETTDLDQLLMWQAAREFAAGRFHEPAFWGQDYNTMVEGLLAAPLVFFGLSPAVVTPLMTSVLAVLPFLAFAGIAWRKGRPIGALCCLSIPILLPTRFTLVTSMPRGFIPGIAVAACGAALSMATLTRWRLFAFGALSSLAFSIMPNGLPLIAASSVFVGAAAHKKWRTGIPIAIGAIGALAGMAYHLYRWYFYTVRHPDYLMFPSIDTVSVNLSSFLSAIPKAGLFFDDVLPRPFWGGLGLPLCIICVMLVCYGKANRCARWAVALSAVVVLGILFNPKVHNASESVFYSYSRFFLAIPYVFALCFASSEMVVTSQTKRMAIAAFSICGLLCVVLMHVQFFSQQLEEEMAKPNPVAATLTVPLREMTERIGQVQRRRRVAAWVFAELHRAPSLAGAALLPEPFVGFLYNDRRRWFAKPNYDRVFRCVAFYGFDSALPARAAALGYQVREVRSLPATFLLVDLQVPIRTVLIELGVHLGDADLAGGERS